MSRALALSLLLLMPGCALLQSYRPDFDPGKIGGDVAKAVTAPNPCKDLREYEITPSDEYYLGRAAAAQVVARYGNDKLLTPDDPLAKYVRRVGNAIATGAAAHTEDSELERYAPTPGVKDRAWPMRGYHFLVVDTDTANAHGMPGGFVVVTTGLIKQTRSEDELGAVLAHEIAHVQRGHGVELVKRALCEDKHKDDEGWKKVVGRQLAEIPVIGGVITSGVSAAIGSINGALLNGYESDLEVEADKLAVVFESFAGYGARSLVPVLQRIPSSGGLFSNHLSASKRIAAVDEVIAREHLTAAAENAPLRQARFKAGVAKIAQLSARESGAGGD